MPDLIGRTLAPYRIVSQIGLGGMATVYKAYQPSMDRYVALKVLSTHFAQDPAFVKRFQQEAKIIARLEHAHILPVYDHGEEDGYLYLVMRYIEAGTLKDRLKQKQLSLGETRRVVTQVGSALEYAHRLGVVHRDIKPSNVLVDPQSDCYLTDFGIAKMIEGTLGLTGSGIVGTPHYMAPEQSRSLAVDHRADVYAMGVVIYEMVTGQLPYDAETPLAVAIKHMTEPLPLPRNIKPDLPEVVERVILKALAKDPADRYQSMCGLASAFDQAVQSSVGSAPTVASQPRQVESAPTLAAAAMRVPEFVPTWKRWLSAQPPWLWGVAALVVVALVVMGVVLSQPVRAPETGTALLLATSTAAVARGSPPTVAPLVAPATVAPGVMSKPAPSPADQVHAFADPILQTIASRPPDFQDDFSNPKSGWWQVESADKGKSDYAGGEFSMITDPPPLSPGWHCNVATGPWPKLADFALEADERLVSGKQVSLQIQFRVWDRLVQPEGGAYVLTFDGEGFGLMRCHDKGCPNLGDYSGSAIRRGTESNHIQIVARGARVAVYINGEPAMYLEDGNDSQDFRSGRINLVACNMSNVPMEARWDNLRIWDLSQEPGPVSPLTPDPMMVQARAFGDPILKTVANKPPDYYDDFGNPKSGWEQIQVMDQGKFEYVDGEYSLVAKGALSPTPVECNGVTAPVRELGDFVFEVDGRFASGKGGNAIMAFRQWRTVGRGNGGYELHFSRPNEAASLRRCDSNGCPAVVDYFGNATKTSIEWNHWQIVAKDSRLAVYVNGEPILYLDDSGFTEDYGSGHFELKVCNVGDMASDVRWDNLRIWDISKLP